MNIKEYKCPNCSAPLHFDGADQQMECANCGNTIDVSRLDDFYSETQRAEKESSFSWDEFKSEKIEGTVIYTCPSCGGEIIGDSATAATKCPYCDNVAILEGRVDGILKPDFVIPFKTTKEQAITSLKNYYMDKKLLPDSFKDENRLQEIRGIYVPFWLFDCDASADITYDATRVNSWISGDYRYTKTEHFLVSRSGELSFEKIPTDASSKIADDLMDSIEPFDYSQGVDFDTAYLSGFFADKFDVDTDVCKPRANLRIENSTEAVIRNTVMGYEAVIPRNKSIRTTNGNIHYALLPIWLLNTKYEGNVYTFAMNGQTGKFIGNLPIDRKKVIKRFFASAAICFAIIAVIIAIGGLLL